MVYVAFPSFGCMQLPVSWPDPAFTKALANQWLRPSETWLIGNNSGNTRNNMKYQIKNKKLMIYYLLQFLLILLGVISYEQS